MQGVLKKKKFHKVIVLNEDFESAFYKNSFMKEISRYGMVDKDRGIQCVKLLKANKNAYVLLDKG